MDVLEKQLKEARGLLDTLIYSDTATTQDVAAARQKIENLEFEIKYGHEKVTSKRPAGYSNLTNDEW